MSSPNHKAAIDAEGNIILPGAGQAQRSLHVVNIQEEEGTFTMEEGVWYTPAAELKPASAFAWDTTEDEEETPVVMMEEEVVEVIETEVIEVEHSAPSYVWGSVREKMYRVTNEAVTESVRQYKSSIEDGSRVSAEAARTLSSSIKNIWSFLTQPVWVPGKKREPVQHSRGVLFVLDTIRFGGTFAALFMVLFVSLNYESFWAIAQSYVDPLAEVTGIKSPDDLDRGVAEKLKRIPALAVAGQSDGSMLDFLPPVGPPDNRIIIPKLNLNVPIVVPPNEALISENWQKLEEDIQEGLQDGVVHYPGTARPGQAGNFFVTGHSSYFPWAPGDYKSVFARLHELKVGDEYWVFYNGDRYRYIIQEKKEIKPADVTVLDQPVGKRIGTLMTCTPVGTTLRRLIITAQEVDPVTGLALDVGEHRHEQQLPEMKMEMLPI